VTIVLIPVILVVDGVNAQMPTVCICAGSSVVKYDASSVADPSASAIPLRIYTFQSSEPSASATKTENVEKGASAAAVQLSVIPSVAWRVSPGVGARRENPVRGASQHCCVLSAGFWHTGTVREGQCRLG
jgi:hypothetical protein